MKEKKEGMQEKVSAYGKEDTHGTAEEESRTDGGGIKGMKGV